MPCSVGDPVNKTLLTILVQKVDDPTEKLFVFFPEDEKVGVKPIRNYLESMKEEQVRRAIVVVAKVSRWSFLTQDRWVGLGWVGFISFCRISRPLRGKR